MQWPRPVEGQPQEPATLVLRVEGPMALEIQHASDVAAAAGQPLLRLERGRPAGAAAGAAVAPRSAQAAPRRRTPRRWPKSRKRLPPVEDEELRAALARLGASIKRN